MNTTVTWLIPNRIVTRNKTPELEATVPTPPTPAAPPRRDKMHCLSLAVVAAVVLAIIVGILAPGFAKDLKPLGTGFVALIKMMISPIIFCTIVLGIGSVAKA